MMRRRVLAALAIVLSVLVVVTPASAAHDATVSIHATDTDFQGAETLDNITVDGSGSSASATLVNSVVSASEGFEDGDIAEYGGQTGDFRTETSPTESGSYALDNIRADSEHYIISDTGRSVAQGDTAEVYMQSDSTGVFQEFVIGTQRESASPGGYAVRLDYRGDFGIYKDPDFNSDGTQLANTSASFAGSTWYRVTVDWDEDGTITATAYNDSGTQVASVTATDTSYTAGGIGFGYNANSLASEIRWDSVEVRTPTDSGTYVGASHSVEEATTGFTNITLSNAEAHVTWQGYDGSSWTDVASSTYTTSGNKSLDLASGGYDSWRVNVTFVRTGDSPTAELHAEGVQATTARTQLDNTSASPSGGEQVTETPTYSINGSDGDFATVQGDTVTLDWYRNGTLLDTTTETANGTWTFTPASGEAGMSQWHVEATDEYGHTATSDTFTYQSPGELSIYNESAPDQLVDGATVTLEFYFEGDENMIVERETSDGTIDMSGLPADQPFIVVANSDGYVSRRIYVESLYDTQAVYLLPDSADFVEPTFVLQDYSGNFNSEDTVLVVQRGINGSWTTVEGDFFGATGKMPAHLQFNVRHRLLLVNTETGQTNQVGTHTPIASGEQQITVYPDGTVDLQGQGARVTVSPQTRRLPALNGSGVTVNVDDQGSTIDSWDVSVAFTNGTTTTELAATSRTTSGGTYAPEFNLSGKAGGTVTVDIEWTTGGETYTRSVDFRVTETYENQYSLLSGLDGLTGLLPDGNVDSFTSMVALFVTVIITAGVGASLPASSEVLGLVAVASLAAFSVIGWVGYGVVFAGTVSWVSLVGLRRGL